MMPISRLLACLLLVSVADIQAAPPAEKPRLDAHGDPLPDGALARLGTVRLRDGNHFSTFSLSPDGKTLAVGSNNQLIRFYDAGTGKEIRQIQGVQIGLSYLSFSPDGKLLAGS